MATIRETVTVQVEMTREYDPETEGATRDADLRSDIEFTLALLGYENIVVVVEHEWSEK